jgi:hypothetical protein
VEDGAALAREATPPCSWIHTVGGQHSPRPVSLRLERVVAVERADIEHRLPAQVIAHSELPMRHALHGARRDDAVAEIDRVNHLISLICR